MTERTWPEDGRLTDPETRHMLRSLIATALGAMDEGLTYLDVLTLERKVDDLMAAMKASIGPREKPRTIVIARDPRKIRRAR